MVSNISYATNSGSPGDMSLRAQKKKRGHQHHAKKYKNDKVLNRLKEMHQETEYYFENGLRKVYPYMFGFNSFVKKRWVGRTVADVYMNDFHGRSEEFLIKDVERGRVTVNGKKVSTDFILKDSHFVEHWVHRHENPVVGGPIQIIDNTPDLVVVNKPASIPCHPCSRYRYNSVTFILGIEHGLKNLRTLYRLDRLTSGVLILPKTLKKTQRWEKQLANREFHKEYVCRVAGEFPEETITCNEPIEVLSEKIWLFKVGPKGKPSSTTFTRLSYNGKSSVVKCVPLTGRSHQIRTHLQYLGHPILNDPLYNRALFWKNKGQDDKDIESSVSEIVNDIISRNNVGRWKLRENPKYTEFLNKQNATQKQNEGISENVKESVTKEEDISESISQSGQQTTKKIESQCAVTGGTKIVLDKGKSVIDIMDPVSDVTIVDAGRTAMESETSDVSVSEMNTPDNQLNSDNTFLVNEEKATKSIKDSHELECTENIPSKRFKMEAEPVPGYSGNTEPKNAGSEKEEVGKQSDQDMDNVKPADVNEEMMKHTVEDVNARPFVMAEFDESKMTYEEDCEECMNLYKDPTPADLVLYLHAVRYKGPDWDYSAPLPDWAAPDWKED